MKRYQMLVVTMVVALLANVVAAETKGSGDGDVLRLSHAVLVSGEYRVAIQVVNNKELAGMDIPLRFGQPGEPLTLERVEWSSRVADWDFKHAAIDNEKKTVILGLISELGGTRPNPYLAISAGGDPTVATLVFEMQDDYRPSFSAFTTQDPGHSLKFLYNRYEDGKPHVEEFTPDFEVSITGE